MTATVRTEDTSPSHPSQEIPWDAFIRVEMRRQGVLDNVMDAHVEAALKHINPFRQTEWPALCHELKKQYGISCPQEVEPHWVAPGYAVLWQPSYHLERDYVNRTLKRVLTGWEPTNGLPANNANQLAYYLKKGLRIRPPLQKVEAAVEAAPPSQASGGREDPSLAQPGVPPSAGKATSYVCDRHPDRFGRSGQFTTTSWKEYRKHCIEHREPLELEPSWDIKSKLARYRFVCPGCWIGCSTVKMAERHYQDFNARRDGLKHRPLLDMAELAQRISQDVKEMASANVPDIQG